MNVKDYDQPIYDSQEDPISKMKNKGPAAMGRGMGRGMAMSSESFGNPNPMIHSSGGLHEQIKNAKNNGKYGRNQRTEIREEGLLENDDDF